jgi:hypothetical protein
MWEYSLTAHEEAIAVQVGYHRQAEFFAKPEKNINYSEGDLWETWQHAVCAGSELAFARMLGWDTFIPHWNKFKELQDLPKFGEIRYTFNHSRGMRFSTRDDVTERYVLVVEGLAKRTRRIAPDYISHPYKAIGWAWGYECMNDDWRYNETTWYVPLDNLRPMESLVYAKSAS